MFSFSVGDRLFFRTSFGSIHYVIVTSLQSDSFEFEYFGTKYSRPLSVIDGNFYKYMIDVPKIARPKKIKKTKKYVEPEKPKEVYVVNRDTYVEFGD